MTDFNNVVSQFRINGIVESVSPIGNGLINETLRVSTIGKDTPDYILQRINDAVFTDVELLQHNIELVTSHIRQKLIQQEEQDVDRKCLQFIKTTDGRTYYQDVYSRYWRMSVFIPDSVTKEEVNPDMCLAERLYRKGVLPKRTCHCDTKVNNMLFDTSGKVLCVIDLDTVMPSFIFSDYGDFLRTGANHVAEDSDNYQAVGLKEDIFKSFTEGYLSSAGSFLTEVETSHLPYAVALFPFMQCVRFLADYLNGDVYFKTKYAEHNLVRSRNQLLLYRDVRRHDQMMADFVQKTLKQ